MATANATVFPSPNTAYRFYGRINSNQTGCPVTGGLTGLVSQISQDGGEFTNTSNAPVEIAPSTGTGSGYFYLDLLSSEIGAYSAIVLRVAATNANAVEAAATLLTGGLGQIGAQCATNIWTAAEYGDAPGRATTVLGQIAQIWRYLFNQQLVNKNAQTQTLYRDNGTAALVQGTITVNSSMTQKGGMS